MLLELFISNSTLSCPLKKIVFWYITNGKQELAIYSYFHSFIYLATSSYCVKVLVFSLIWLFAIPWTVACVACQAALSMEFSRQEYWNGLPFPSPVDLPDPGVEPRSPAFQVKSLPSEPPGKPNWILDFSNFHQFCFFFFFSFMLFFCSRIQSRIPQHI